MSSACCRPSRRSRRRGTSGSAHPPLRPTAVGRDRQSPDSGSSPRRRCGSETRRSSLAARQSSRGIRLSASPAPSRWPRRGKTRTLGSLLQLTPCPVGARIQGPRRSTEGDIRRARPQGSRLRRDGAGLVLLGLSMAFRRQRCLASGDAGGWRTPRPPGFRCRRSRHSSRSSDSHEEQTTWQTGIRTFSTRFSSPSAAR